ncbi:MAG TPA: hypothetical protein VH951_06105 [Dehalococcoidia bacterium]|jgi:hypothetical protein
MTKGADQLLQECLAGLDAGLTPEECLSAWPERRDALEPLLRQAMLLRMAYAARPAPEFKARARESVMFMAGREARQALAGQPSDAFVRRSRQRFLTAAGAQGQEALRAVPPPRLPFWANARRRFLEAATSEPVRRPAPYGGVLAFRGALSAAVLVLAIAVAGLAYFTVQKPEPSIGAQLASIDQELRAVEQQASAGQTVAPEQIAAVTNKLASVGDKASTDPVQAPAAKELIDRTKTLAQQVAADSPEPQVQASIQKLNDLDVKISAAGVLTPITPVSAQTQPTVTTNLAQPTSTPPAAPPTTEPAAASTAVPTALPPLGPNDIRVRVLPNDTSFGLTWVEVETQHFQFAVPANWALVGPNIGANGIGRYDVPRLTFVSNVDGFTLLADVNSGEIDSLVGGNLLPLRAETALGSARISIDELITRTGTLAPQLDHMLASVVHSVPTPTPTATATATATQTSSPVAAPPSVTPTP